MREILFRGKAIDGNWYYGVPLVFTEDYVCMTAPHTHNKKVEANTIGQFTGLTDKNGNKIFEGDIFKFPDEIFESYYTSCGTEYNSWEVENYGIVGFSEDLGRFDFVDYKFNENAVDADLHENHDIEFYDFVSDLEVIGNIHDNPELLKGDKSDA